MWDATEQYVATSPAGATGGASQWLSTLDDLRYEEMAGYDEKILYSALRLVIVQRKQIWNLAAAQSPKHSAIFTVHYLGAKSTVLCFEFVLLAALRAEEVPYWGVIGILAQ